MRIRTMIITAALAASTSVFAGQSITKAELDQTLIDAQNAIESRDYERAFELYSQAAQWGHKGAQYVLGEMYSSGKGTKEDDVLGLAWLEVAAEARNREFIKARNDAADDLSANEIKKAEQLADQISDAYGLEASQMTCRKEMRVGSNIKVVNCYHKRLNGNDIVVPEQQGDFYAS